MWQPDIFHRNPPFQPKFIYCFNCLLYSIICCGILIFENYDKKQPMTSPLVGKQLELRSPLGCQSTKFHLQALLVVVISIYSIQ